MSFDEILYVKSHKMSQKDPANVPVTGICQKSAHTRVAEIRGTCLNIRNSGESPQSGSRGRQEAGMQQKDGQPRHQGSQGHGMPDLLAPFAGKLRASGQDMGHAGDSAPRER